MFCTMSQQCSKFFNRKTGIFNNAAHRKRLNWIMTRDSDKAFSIAHHNMFTLSNNLKANFFKSAYCIKMIDARQFRHCYAATSIL